MKLGKWQIDALQFLSGRHNLYEKTETEWFPGCGSIWGTNSESLRIFNSLAKRGLVHKSKFNVNRFTITESGREALKKI